MEKIMVIQSTKGQSIVRPPFFDRENYPYWKNKIELFIQANDYEVWRLIVNGPQIPMKMVDGRSMVKDESEWNIEDIKKAQLNAKALHTLFCALGPSEYNRVSMCASAKEAWDKLEVTHECTNQVKETRIGMLTLDYELFKMLSNESITKMFDRFTNIINGLKGLGKTYPNKEMVKKLLNSLPKSWEAKVTTIKESKDLNTLPLNELIGSLLTHEMKLMHGQESNKRVGIALKSTTLFYYLRFAQIVQGGCN
ncbi:hypothetical protein PTKIN_Ptkin13bG0035100 [Pterospermum kingtungense]